MLSSLTLTLGPTDGPLKVIGSETVFHAVKPWHIEVVLWKSRPQEIHLHLLDCSVFWEISRTTGTQSMEESESYS